MEKVEQIINALTDRSGFDDLWRNIDEETQEEIKQEILIIINK